MAERQEVFLPDERVLPIQELLTKKYPLFKDWGTDFVSVRHEASPDEPYEGQLPEGPMGRSEKPVVQFLIVSDYPATRPIQRKQGVRHGTSAITYEDSWEEAEKEHRNGHYVHQGIDDPLLVIFAGLAYKHTEEMMSLSSIMN